MTDGKKIANSIDSQGLSPYNVNHTKAVVIKAEIILGGQDNERRKEIPF
jgi:hypothetical protein